MGSPTSGVREARRVVEAEDASEAPAGLAAGALAAGSTYSRFSLALVRRAPELPYTGAEELKRPSAVAPFLHRLLRHEPYECLGAVLLSCRGRPIGHTIPFRGTLSACKVEPRALLLTALLANAAGLVAFHAHPSGDPTPSAEDRGFARRLRAAGEILGVDLCDFIVLGEPPTFWSLRDVAQQPAGPVRRRRTRRPKYRHPGDRTKTWAGTGHMPVWLRQEIEDGAALADFLVDGAEVTDAAARQERQIRERAGVRGLGSGGNGPAQWPSTGTPGHEP